MFFMDHSVCYCECVKLSTYIVRVELADEGIDADIVAMNQIPLSSLTIMEELGTGKFGVSC